MISRYTRPEMGELWSQENKFRCLLDVELTPAPDGGVPDAVTIDVGDIDARPIDDAGDDAVGDAAIEPVDAPGSD